jgi:alpha-ketoglutaric semialdehyde dehydrogenase
MTNVRLITNWIYGEKLSSASSEKLIKVNPHTGEIDSHFSASSAEDVFKAVTVAESTFESWSKVTPVARGNLLGAWVRVLREHQNELAEIVARETGKRPQDALGEVGAAISQGEYFAGEGMRLYGRSLTSGMPGKYSHTVRKPRGVVGLIVPANTPIANIAWKVFPALICGNTIVLKASEDAPEIALRMAQFAKQAGIPDGVINIIQGAGDPAGKALVEDNRVAVISFTGSTDVGRWIAKVAGSRLARVSLELGGKNPFVVCDDADQEAAVHWATLSAFSNAGQRCASASRILVFDNIYDDFVSRLVVKAQSLKLGIDKDCDLGPVINARQHSNILAAIDQAKKSGGKVLCGGSASVSNNLKSGFYVQPTIIADLPYDAELCSLEIFGPVVTVQRVKDSEHALQVANNNEYGLTAAIHTTNVDRAMWFAQNLQAGTVNINIGTYGSEPHMPFGGFGASGNGTREPGAEALDVYSELKNIAFLVRDENL